MHGLAMLQAGYFCAAGVWPIVHMPSFLRMTGPKTDLWLVRTVGVLVTAIGFALAVASWRGQINLPIVILAVSTAAGLAIIDIVFVARGTIAKIYLMDAVVEVVLIGMWCAYIAR